MNTDEEPRGKKEADSFTERYQLIRTLGEGATAIVVLAKHKKSNERVAVKIVDKTHDDWDEATVEAFQNEIRILAKFQYKYLVSMRDIMVPALYLTPTIPFLSASLPLSCSSPSLRHILYTYRKARIPFTTNLPSLSPIIPVLISLSSPIQTQLHSYFALFHLHPHSILSGNWARNLHCDGAREWRRIVRSYCGKWVPWRAHHGALPQRHPSRHQVFPALTILSALMTRLDIFYVPFNSILYFNSS